MTANANANAKPIKPVKTEEAANPQSGREAAFAALEAQRKRAAWPEEVIRGAAGNGLDPRETALAMRLCLGVQQTRALLDWYIGQVSTKITDKLDPAVLDILRLGVYQLLYLDRVPAHAAVSESVTLAGKRTNSGAAGFVNAVLRKLSRDIPAMKPPEDPAIRYSCPGWLVDELKSTLGREGSEAFLKCVNTEAPVTVQVNTLKATAEEAEKSLAADGVAVSAVRHPELPDCLLLDGAGNPERLKAFQNGLIYVQDAAARLTVLASGIKPGMTVLDACAAPGGKSFAAAIQMENRGRIIARDIHENKLVRIRDGAARLGITSIETQTADASDPAKAVQADVVLADVPCSGFGVIRAKPGIRYKEPSSLERLPEVQMNILDALAESVKPGGVLLYSTCTIFERENGDVVRAFCAEHPEFQPEPFRIPIYGASDGGAMLWPQIHGTDGFFIAKLRREAASAGDTK